MLTEPAPPLAHGVVGDSQASSDRGIRRAAGSGQHDPGTQHVAVFTAGSASPGQQQLPLTGTKNDLVRTQNRHGLVVTRQCPVRRRHAEQGCSSIMDAVPTPPDSTKNSLRYRLIIRTRERWPQLADLTIRHRGQFAYIDGKLADGTTLPLFRLRYGGSANSWGFAIHLASRDGYQDAILPSGYPVGTPEEALDCACGLYLNDPTAWIQPPTN